MNADEHGFLDSLTGLVLGSIFEVANTLGAGFSSVTDETRNSVMPAFPHCASFCPAQPAPKPTMAAWYVFDKNVGVVSDVIAFVVSGKGSLRDRLDIPDAEFFQ